MTDTRTRQQLQAEAALLQRKRAILLGALGQDVSPARKAKLMEDLTRVDMRALECQESLQTINVILESLNEASNNTAEAQMRDAQARGDMGAMTRQDPNANVKQKQETENPIAKELQIDPQLAERIQKMLKSGDDEKIQKGLEKGDKTPGKKDPKTNKMAKEFKAKMKQFKKLHAQMVRSLKKLHHSDSEEVQRSMLAIRKGKVDVGMRGLKGVSRTGGFQNETANAAKDLMGSIEGMYRLAGLNTMMIFRREFDKTANQPNWNAGITKNESDMRLDSATERADSVDKIIADIAMGTADEKQKKTAVSVGVMAAAAKSSGR